MLKRSKNRAASGFVGVALAAVLGLTATAAQADGRGHDRHYYGDRGHGDRWHGRGHDDGRWRHDRRGPPPRVVVVPPRYHQYRRDDRRVVIVRPGAPRYYPYYDRRPHRPPPQWLGLNFLFHLNSFQRDAYDDAWRRSVAAPVGRPVVWSTGDAEGRLVAVNEGYAADDRYCREFQQSVTIDRRTQEAYGTACLQPDGDWEVVASR